ncbi:MULTISPECIES: CoA ester lyase [unclassified Streptomyces]|uniref:CoA ester lyase n=3 Tax=Streptomyces TaxID=1883 RepID=A0ABD5E923_9ACTN|nr:MULTISPECIES: CoA ester lyase [unclassified Streptomyces]MDT0417925.1 CoA ester lyase [Streptomyces sp. DSM 41982]MYR29175.1 CoA ester lyase [Streptomyces sp. SID4945]SCD93248.1 citrate lyase subunit beta / citryl-CoA lyase [Streptomyces sp. TverLS-915]SCF44469.1 citrate lyase subunit beta / citryl-CoA lyase [Streptomyces sp. LcepLS]
MTSEARENGLSSTPLTWLYVPGDRPARVEKALAAGADVVLVDLEDAVAPDGKEYARAAVAELLSAPVPVPVHVRVNHLDGPWGAHDVAALVGLPHLSGLRLPKSRGPEDVRRAAVACGGAPIPELYPILECPLGVERAFEVATAHPAVRGVALGESDLRAALGVRGDAGLDHARGRVVLAAGAAGLAPPAQSVYPDVRDEEGLAASCRHGRDLGFFGRAAIHPRQLAVIEHAWRPGGAEVAAADEVLSAAAEDGGAFALPDGRFVDAALVAVARRTKALAERLGVG